MVARLMLIANELGLPFGKRTMTFNSRLAQELGLWAIDQGQGDRFHQAAFHYYFAQGLNLADHNVLLTLVEQVNLSKENAQNVINQRLYKDSVDKDWNDARLLGITAVPTFIMGHHKLVGMQSYETLQELVEHYGNSKR